MKNPFTFGHLTDIDSFVNREDEIKYLNQNINNQIHTILVSPRRWGKSSMVNVLERKIGKSKDTVFCHLDLYNTADEKEFLDVFSNKIISSVYTKSAEFLKSISNLFKKLTPKFSIETGDKVKLSMDFDLENDRINYDEILDLAENIAIKKKKKLVICIDEFQNIENFKNHIDFQKRLRAHWQHHQNVVYILYGSKRSMMSSLFEKQSMPFYKFGDVIYLQKIAPEHFIKFIVSKFRKTKKKISKANATEITDLMDNHPYYIQQFAHIVWNNTESEVDDDIMQISLADIIGRNSLLFDQMFENLSYYQRKVLKMLIFEKSDKYTTNENILRYELQNSANVIQALNALEKKEIIDRFEGSPMFLDPVFKMWLRKRVFVD